MVDRGIHDARRTEESTTHGGQWNSRRTVDRRIHDARRTEESTTLGDTGNPSLNNQCDQKLCAHGTTESFLK